MIKMKSVKNNEHTIIVKNSKFICYLFQIETWQEITNYLQDIKTKYPDATHHCYAYILDNIKKESDDGEPSGTAGIPILQVLEKNQLNHVLCIVVRYFGKIKLGAGGLVRAYTKSVTETLKDHITTLTEGFCVNLTFSYDKVKAIDYLLKDIAIVNKEFANKITYQIHISKDQLQSLNALKDVEINILYPLYLPLVK